MNLAEKLPSSPVFKWLQECASDSGMPVYLVGGYVRDILLGRPSKDIDVVCIGSGPTLAELFHQKSGASGEVRIFRNFGTAMVRLDDLEVEFVGARKESYRNDSRKPVVENGSLRDDQLRRDFTINALAISMNPADYGELTDPFEGVKDLEEKTIRTPLEPGQTFSDDPLRMMRACRFASQLNFDIAPDTFDAIGQYKDRILIVSQERIIDELNKIILSPVPSYGFKLLYFSGLLQIIFPELVALQGAEIREGKGHKDNFFHTLQVLDNVAALGADLWLRWAALMHDIAKPATKRYDEHAGWTFHGHEEKGARMVPGIFRKMKLPLDDKMRFVQKLVRLHLRPIALVKEEVSDSAVRRLLFEAGEDINELMKLCRADITSKNDNKVKRYMQNFTEVEKKLKEVEEKDHLRNFQPVIDGLEIMQIFNLPPGKLVGELKTALREAILEGEIPNEYNPAYAFLLQLGLKHGISADSIS